MVMRVSLRIEWFALAGHSHSVVPQARHYSKSASFHREVYFTLKMGIIELLEQPYKMLGSNLRWTSITSGSGVGTRCRDRYSCWF